MPGVMGRSVPVTSPDRDWSGFGSLPEPHPWMLRARRVHFVGVGGAGMGGIAEVLHTLGFEVSGSDLAESGMTRHLGGIGVRVHGAHRAAHVAHCDVVVRSAAVPEDNVELEEARVRGIPILPRAQMLAELMRFRHGIAVAGTHGKTTTTSLVTSVLAEGGLDPTCVIGGRLNSIGSNARLGVGPYLVAEADESDRSFLRLQPVVAVVTNIDADHMEAYGNDLGQLEEAFVEFLQRLPFYGLAVVCGDDPSIASILPRILRAVRTYGFAPGSAVRAMKLRQTGMRTTFRVSRRGRETLEVSLNLPGRHNVYNALAAIAVATELEVADDAICRALHGFQGIARRLQVHGERLTPRGRVTLVDDYAHHPRELSAVLEAVRAGFPGRRLLAVFQPHRYTRTRALFEDFVGVLADLDALVLLEVYRAGEAELGGADGRALCRALRVRGRVNPVFVESPGEVPALLDDVAREGDVVLTLGAGDVGALPGMLKRHWAAPIRSGEA